MRGLARFEPPQPNLLVAYAARDDQVALDGKAAEGSPRQGLVKPLAEPRLELSVFFRRVHAEVLAETQDQHRPFEYGSLISEELYFRPEAVMSYLPLRGRPSRCRRSSRAKRLTRAAAETSAAVAIAPCIAMARTSSTGTVPSSGRL